MIERIHATLSYDMGFYQSFVIKEWNNMTPGKYGSLLLMIAAVGYVMMRNNGQRK